MHVVTRQYGYYHTRTLFIKSKVLTWNRARMWTKGGSVEVAGRSSLLIVNTLCPRLFLFRPWVVWDFICFMLPFPTKCTSKPIFLMEFIHGVFNNVINRSVTNCFITFLILTTVNTQHYLSGVWVPSLSRAAMLT